MKGATEVLTKWHRCFYLCNLTFILIQRTGYVISWNSKLQAYYEPVLNTRGQSYQCFYRTIHFQSLTMSSQYSSYWQVSNILQTPLDLFPDEAVLLCLITQVSLPNKYFLFNLNYSFFEKLSSLNLEGGTYMRFILILF